VKKDRILGCIEDILSDDSVTSDNKTRLLMIYLAAENLQPSDKVDVVITVFCWLVATDEAHADDFQAARQGQTRP